MAATPIVNNLSGTVFLMLAETGLIIKKFTRGTSREEIMVYDPSVGYDVGSVDHNPKASYSISGITTSGTVSTPGGAGIAAAAPGVALTIANLTYGNGVGTSGADNGGVYTQTTSLDQGEKALREISVTARQHPGIP